MNTQLKIPDFKGKFLIPAEIRDACPQVNYLQGDFGKAVLEQYNARVKEDHNNHKHLKIFSYSEKQDCITGSNSFGNVLLNNILSEYNPALRIVTQADLETILREGVLDLKKTYENTGLVLRSVAEPNFYLARDLSEQLQKRGQLSYPVLLHLKDLTLRNKTDSPHGLAFTINENAELLYDAIVNVRSGYFSSKDIDEKTGLPKKLGEGDRYFYTRDKGLSKLFLNNGLGALANDGYLAYSNDLGRVVAISRTEGAQKNAVHYSAQLQEEAER